MTVPSVPQEADLFDIATATRAGCTAVYGGNPEEVIALLAAGAFQLQAAWVGARMAAMANDANYTAVLREIATDYGGVSAAALNLSVRCSATAVDLCAAALGRLTGLNPKTDIEFKARDIRRTCSPARLSDERLVALATMFHACVSGADWRATELLRNEATHRRYQRGVYGTTRATPVPPPLAHPQQVDISHGTWGMIPLDKLAADTTRFADDTFREFCRLLAALA
jgi:hypothetical protein